MTGRQGPSLYSTRTTHSTHLHFRLLMAGTAVAMGWSALARSHCLLFPRCPDSTPARRAPRGQAASADEPRLAISWAPAVHPVQATPKTASSPRSLAAPPQTSSRSIRAIVHSAATWLSPRGASNPSRASHRPPTRAAPHRSTAVRRQPIPLRRH